MAIKAEIIKRYPGFTLEVSIDDQGLRTGILGASGCGKSMTLRAIAGVVTPDEGHIEIDRRVVFDSVSRVNVPSRFRNVGYLFQHYALFPTMTVEENIRIVLRETEKKRRRRGRTSHTIQGVDLPRVGPRLSIAAQTSSLIERFHLQGLEKRRPAELSGGQQQRVALARIFAMEPAAVLLDEPFSALDSHLRAALEAELTETLNTREGSVLFVSHDRDEVFRVCERMIVMDAGRIAAEGGVREVFDNPGTAAAARLTGCKNVERAVPAGATSVSVPGWGLEFETGRPVPPELTHVGIRAHHIHAAQAGCCVNLFEGMARSSSHDPFSKSEYVHVLDGEREYLPSSLFRISDEIDAQDGELRWRVFSVNPEDILLLR